MYYDLSFCGLYDLELYSSKAYVTMSLQFLGCHKFFLSCFLEQIEMTISLEIDNKNSFFHNLMVELYIAM